VSRALIIVDHGSRREEAHEHLEWIAARVRVLRADLPVYVAHLELAAPSIQEAIDRCVADGAREIWVHPLFLGPGRHLSEDVATLVEAAASRHAGLSTRITRAVGQVPDLAELILSTLDS
jgi:sirohydrochlorin ferrochelatase